MRSGLAGLSPCAGGPRGPGRRATAVRPKATAAAAVVTMVEGLPLALLVMLLLCASSVLGKEIKALGFYPPFQRFNARGVVVVMVVVQHTATRSWCVLLVDYIIESSSTVAVPVNMFLHKVIFCIISP